MITDDQLAYGRAYREILADIIEGMGGEAQITPLQGRAARRVATLQRELELLNDRLASNAQGGNSDDLNLYLRLSTALEEKYTELGIVTPKAVQQNEGGSYRAKVHAAIANLIRARKQDEAEGIFKAADGTVITDPRIIALRTQIRDLQKQCEDIADGAAQLIDVTPPAPAIAAPAIAAPAPEPDPPPDKPASPNKLPLFSRLKVVS
jgi:hypothetical protein